ncbi:MAG: PAS domain S-box protein [Candidatus Paceibacterota bacterium]|jgi:PAS domain S-box-containing protein
MAKRKLKQTTKLLSLNKKLAFDVKEKAKRAAEQEKTLEKLKESESKFKNIFDHSAVGVSIVSLDGRWLEVNDALCHITGYSRKELLKDKFNKITHPDDVAKGIEATKKLLSGKVDHTYLEKRYLSKKGKIVWVFLSISLVRDKKGKPLYFVTHTEDITERREAEEALSIKNYIFDNSLYANSIADTRANITDVNKSFLDILGFKSKKEVIGKSVAIFFKDKKESGPLLKTLEKTGKWVGTIRAQRKDGTEIFVYGLITKLFDVNGKFIGYQSSTYDVSRTREIEEQYKNYLRMTPRGAHIFQLIKGELILVAANSSADKILGIDHAKLLNKTIKRAFPGLNKTKIPQIYSQVVKTGKSWQGEVPYDDGKIKGYFDVVAFRLSKNKMAASFIDISERKRDEALIKESEERYSTMVEATNSLVYDLDILTGKILWRGNAKELTGYSNLEFSQNVNLDRWLAMIHPEDRGRANKLLELAQRTKKQYFVNYRFRHKSGKYFWVQDVGSFLYNNIGQAYRMLGTMRDVSDLAMAEEKMKESEEKFRKVFEEGGMGMAIVSLDFKFARVNKIFSQMLGYSERELQTMTFPQITHSEEISRDKENIGKLIKGKFSVYRREKRYIRKDGRVVWGIVNVSLIRDNNGKPLYMVVLVEDTNEKHESEEELKESEEKFRTLFENANDAIWLMEGSVFVDCNQQTVKLFKCRNKSEMIGHTPLDFSPLKQPDGQDSKGKALTYIEKAYSGLAQRFYWRHQKKDGEPLDMDISLNRINLKGKNYLQAVGRDITEKRKSEEVLLLEKTKAEKARVQDEAMLASIGDGLVAVDQFGKIILVNKAAEKMLGISGKQVVGRPLVEAWRATDSKGRIFSEIERPISLALRGQSTTSAGSEYFYTKSDGRIFPVSLSAAPIRMAGKIIGAIDVFRDITREMELDQAKDDFLSLASHQLRTPLSASKWVLEMLSSDKSLSPKQKERLADLSVSNERLINLVNDLLDATRIESGKIAVNKKNTNLSELIGDLSSSFVKIAEEKGKIVKVDLPAEPVEAFCDPLLIHEALENLISNALIYSPRESREVSVSLSERDKDYLVAVHNEGVVDESIAGPKIFEKFVRGSQAGKKLTSGSGLGLYIAKKVTEANGGSIWFESRPDIGTTFYLTIIKNK